MVSPMWATVSATGMPAALSAATLSAAVPLPPEMMAPAWPMRLPGGAWRPAIKAETGLFGMFSLIHFAASSSAVPPISPMMRTA